MGDVFKKRKYVCDNLHRFTDMRWESAGLPSCECGAEVHQDGSFQIDKSASVIGDEIDIVVQHGLVDANGNPQRFRSMTDLRRAAQEKGLTISGETPKMSPEYADRRAAEDAKFGFNYGKR